RRGALLARAGGVARLGSAALALRTAVEGISPRAPVVPMFAASLDRIVDGESGAAELDERYWAEALRGGTRLVDGVSKLTAAGHGPIVELGARSGLESLLGAVAALHVAGAPISFAAMGASRALPMPLYPFEREAFWFERVARADAPAARPEAAAPVAAAADAAPVATAAQVRELVEREVGQLLGFGRRRLDPGRGFFQMGMDSVMASQLRNRLEVQLGRKFPVSIVFEHPTVTSLSQHLADELGGRARAESTPTAPATAAPPGPVADDQDDDDLLEVLRRELDTNQAAVTLP
ncbi:MAG TPA: phosphopantetheine-binding protein, partial [Kofleriaceae bacterium]|nr:phosphopantetheine-binding protein [Kofleriaceae bacterium]